LDQLGGCDDIRQGIVSAYGDQLVVGELADDGGGLVALLLLRQLVAIQGDDALDRQKAVALFRLRWSLIFTRRGRHGRDFVTLKSLHPDCIYSPVSLIEMESHEFFIVNATICIHGISLGSSSRPKFIETGMM